VTLKDTCPCGAVFSVWGLPGQAQELWVTWHNAHLVCRNGAPEIKLVDR
jgi:hypothetical protein